ncbi:MAG: hypothetical protein ACJ798_13810 [Phenylobacterium sp.]
MADSSRPTETARPVLGETRARQGRYGRHMVWVLLGGLFLVIAAFAALWAYRAGDFASANSNNGPGNVDAPPGNAPPVAFHAPEPAPINPQPYQKATPPETNHTRRGP